jgi:hypothetical protein
MNRSPPNDRIPLFLPGPAAEPEQSGVRKVVSSDIIRKVVLVFAAAAVVFAVVSVGNVLLFASVTASQVSTPAPQDRNDHSVPAIQSTASAEALPGNAPGDELLAAFKSAVESKNEVDPPEAETLFNQFQAWAAEEDAQAPARPLEPVQDAQTHIVQKPPLPKRRPIQAARAQDPSPRNGPSLLRRFGWRN